MALNVLRAHLEKEKHKMPTSFLKKGTLKERKLFSKTWKDCWAVLETGYLLLFKHESVSNFFFESKSNFSFHSHCSRAQLRT